MSEAQTPSFGARATAVITAAGAEAPAALNPANSLEEKLQAHIEERFDRIPMSVPQQKLATPELPGFHCHWINDYPGRINQAMRAGYSFVEPGEAVINNSSLAGDQYGNGTDLGSRISLTVGQAEGGGGLRAYLMKIPSKLFEQDQRAIAAHVDQVHDAMQLDLSADGRTPDSEGRYSPLGIKIGVRGKKALRGTYHPAR